MSSDTSDSEILLKASSLLLHTIFFGCPVGAIDILGSLFRIPDILSEKKVAILFANSELSTGMKFYPFLLHWGMLIYEGGESGMVTLNQLLKVIRWISNQLTIFNVFL